MEGILSILYLLYFIFGILSIILFFKLWKMTNDVAEMHDSLSRIVRHLIPESELSGNNASKFSVGDTVVIKATGKRTSIVKISLDGSMHCFSNGGMYDDGWFKEDELYTLVEYASLKKD